MDAIGFRVSPKRVVYAIVRREANGAFTLARVGELLVPAALETPRQLQFIRTVLLDIIEENAVTRAGLRITEATARRKDPYRLNMEGVVQELLTISSVERFVSGPIATMASLLGESDRTVVKRFVGGEKPKQIAADWRKLDELEREAVLIAIGAASDSASRIGAGGRAP